MRQTDPDRWEYEVELTRLAWEQKVPVLDICRGCQTMAEALDGGQVAIIRENTMVGGKHYQRGRAAETSHAIETAANSRLRTILGQVAKVNSFHRQFVSQPPTGFSATAFSDDGYIESIEAENGFTIGVQFHPEWLYQNCSDFILIFSEMIQQAATCAGMMGNSEQAREATKIYDKGM